MASMTYSPITIAPMNYRTVYVFVKTDWQTLTYSFDMEHWEESKALAYTAADKTKLIDCVQGQQAT